MYVEDDFPKFTKHLGKLISAQWSKIKGSSSSSQSDKNIDQQLEEEYETLLREIDYLTTEKSCYLSFLNENFNKAKSSEDLSKILKKHSSEVLRNYLKNHNQKVQHGDFNNKQDLINYITEITVSKTKTCNNKLCSCKPIKVSKEVLTDNSTPQGNKKETQTDTNKYNAAEKATSIELSVAQKENQTKSYIDLKKVSLVTVPVQTDYWSHDPLCKCGCCPKNGSPIHIINGITNEKSSQDDSTINDGKVTESNNASTNCKGENVEISIDKRLCVPYNFDKLIENYKTTQKFSSCAERKDCACDAYDIKEALRRGLVLPSSDICIQKKIVEMMDKREKGKKKGPKNKRKVSDSSEGNETTDTTLSSDNKNKRKEKEKKINKKEKKKDIASSSNNTPREKSKKTIKPFSCFTRKKMSRCDEYCMGIDEEHRSVQTLPIQTYDKSEWACLCNDKDKKAVQTSTESQAVTQVSQSSSSDRKFWSRANNKLDRETEFRPEDIQDKETFSRTDNIHNRGTSPRTGSQESIDHLKNNSKSNKNRDNKEKSKDRICNRCGRPRRDCVSACRNTIIIPYGSSSSRAIPAAEVDSLRMLIKMQSRDTNRQFDNMRSELNHQKSEMRRLNDMYQKMMQNFYEMQKSSSSTRFQNKRSSENFSSRQRSDTAKECGCGLNNECLIKQDEAKRYDPTASNNSNNSNQLKRFGPPNTVVAINRCDVCNVEIAGNSVRACFPPKEIDYQGGDKQRKDQLNQSKKTGKSKQNLSTRKENIPSVGDIPREDSVSTLYNIYKAKKEQMDKKNLQENLLDETVDHKREPYRPHSSKTDVFETETESTGSEKKTRGIYSSRILIWLKKSWISIKHKTKKCRNKEKEKREEHSFKCMLKFCHYKAKQAATGIWNATKNAF